MADLKTNYKDDVLDTSVNEKRKFNMIQNADGTVSFEDVTEYSQVGDSFGAADINATNAAVNEANSNLNVRYSEDTDMVQVFFDGVWNDIMKAGLLSVDLFNTTSTDWTSSSNKETSTPYFSKTSSSIKFSQTTTQNGTVCYFKYTNPIRIRANSTLKLVGTAVCDQYCSHIVQISIDGSTWDDLYSESNPSSSRITKSISTGISLSQYADNDVYIRVYTQSYIGTNSSYIEFSTFKIE